MRYIAFLAVLIAALTLSPSAAAATDWAWPVRGDVITPYKNGDDPYAPGQHRGIDIAAPIGARVDAASGGRVTYAGVAGSSGLTVSVRTADGRYDLSYLHLSAAAVKEGDVVDRGDSVGAVGTTGRRSADQPHLHFGVREAGDRHAYRDPLDLLPAPAAPVTDTPPPAAVASPDPAVAPPASAPALARAPEPAAVVSLAPVPVGAAGAALAEPGVATAPAAQGAGPTSAPAPSRSPGAHGRSGRAASPAGRVTAGSRRAPQHALSPDRDAAPGRTASPAAHRVTHADMADNAPPEGRADRHDSSADPGLGAASAGPRTDGADHTARLAVRDRRGAESTSGDPGLNIGWLAAVIGLVAAATCLGHPQSAQRAARTGRRAIVTALRPLAGRG